MKLNFSASSPKNSFQTAKDSQQNRDPINACETKHKKWK